MRFFFNDTATTEIYTLSLHDALPISFRNRSWRSAQDQRTRSSTYCARKENGGLGGWRAFQMRCWLNKFGDRKSTRLNSSHGYMSYAVLCLEKKGKHQGSTIPIR